MLRSRAFYPTQHGSKYLQQLCKHFGHKVEVTFDDTTGTASLPAGPAKLEASAEGLSIEVTGPEAKDIIQARFVVDSHLVTFAHRENFTGLTWSIEQVNA